MSNILEKLSRVEQEYLVREATSIARKSDGSLEDVLSSIATRGKAKQYGWEEAILSGHWFRYPSEVGEQIFCSENALMNFLLARTLRIPSTYVLGEDYKDSGLGHEVVVVPNGHLSMLDWGFVPNVQMDDESLQKDDGSVVLKSPLKLEDIEVLERVEALRTGDMFMQAITSGQQLYRRFSTAGELEAFVSYDEESQTVEYLYLFSLPMAMLPIYFSHKMAPSENGFTQVKELGIASDRNGIKMERTPMVIETTENGKRAPEMVSFSFSGGLERQREILTSIWYDWITRGDEPYAGDEDDRMDLLGMARKDPESELSFLADAYDYLHKHNPEAATRFLDYQGFSFTIASEIPHEFELVGEVFRRIGFKSFRGVEIYFTAIIVGMMSKFFSQDRTLQTENRLTEALSNRTGMPYSEERSNPFYTLIEEAGDDLFPNIRTLFED